MLNLKIIFISFLLLGCKVTAENKYLDKAIDLDAERKVYALMPLTELLQKDVFICSNETSEKCLFNLAIGYTNKPKIHDTTDFYTCFYSKRIEYLETGVFLNFEVDTYCIELKGIEGEFLLVIKIRIKDHVLEYNESSIIYELHKFTTVKKDGEDIFGYHVGVSLKSLPVSKISKDSAMSILKYNEIEIPEY